MIIKQSTNSKDVSTCEGNTCSPIEQRLLAGSAPHWHERAAERLFRPLGKFLDYGCGTGILLEQLAGKYERGCGVDVKESSLEQARGKCPDCEFKLITKDGSTSYPDATFDTIALVEVIEHVPDEAATLREIARLLKPGGRLVLTTPHAGLLTFLDSGNFKFIFPRLHQLIHRLLIRDKKYYQQRFEESSKVGLIGDVTVSTDRRTWHRHYKIKKLASYAPPELQLTDATVYFPGMRAFLLLQVIMRVITFGRFRKLPPPLSFIQRRASLIRSRLGDQLVAEFVRV